MKIAQKYKEKFIQLLNEMAEEIGEDELSVKISSRMVTPFNDGTSYLATTQKVKEYTFQFGTNSILF